MGRGVEWRETVQIGSDRANCESGKSTSYWVTYRYEAPAAKRSGVALVSNASYEETALVSRESYQALTDGDPVIVLHDPSRPDRSLLAEHSDFEIIGRV